jgi:hypothetical protein
MELFCHGSKKLGPERLGPSPPKQNKNYFAYFNSSEVGFLYLGLF